MEKRRLFTVFVWLLCVFHFCIFCELLLFFIIFPLACAFDIFFKDNDIFMLATKISFVSVSVCANNLLRFYEGWHQLIVVGIIYSLILIITSITKNPLHSIIKMLQIFWKHKSRFVFSTDLCDFVEAFL